MSLYRKLNAIVGRYKSDLLLIREFVTSTLEGLDDLGKIFEQQKGKLTSEDLEALLAVGEALKEVANEAPRGRKKGLKKTVQTTSRANQIILSGIKNRGFLAEMALSYIISFQEGFTKDYLEEALYNRPELLKSGKNLSFEDAVRFTSIATLRRHLARIETDALGYGSIDDLGAYLQKKFNITVQQEPFWPSLREASYRRNLIIHNRGVVNEIYRSKINSRAGSKLETNSNYVNTATDATLSLIDFVHKSITKKLRLKKERQRGENGVEGIADKNNGDQISIAVSETTARAQPRRGRLEGPT